MKIVWNLFLILCAAFFGGCLKRTQPAHAAHSYYVAFPVDHATTTNVSDALYKSLWRVLANYSFPLATKESSADFVIKTAVTGWLQKHRLESELWYDYQPVSELEVTVILLRQSDGKVIAKKNISVQTFPRRPTNTARYAAYRGRDERDAADRAARLIAVFLKSALGSNDAEKHK